MRNAMAPGNGSSLSRTDDPILSDEKLWQVVSSGDLKGLSPKQKSDYFLFRCRQEGLNPASQPFQYMTLQGKEILYAGKSAADQLRKLHGISITSVACHDDGEYIECEVRVRDREGREDYETGVVFVGTAKGVERANAKMKCLTKAKRRATYSICGTGVLDETEVETIPGASLNAVTPHVRVLTPEAVADGEARTSGALAEGEAVVAAAVVTPDTGEIREETLEQIDADIKEARIWLGWSARKTFDAALAQGIDAKTRSGRVALRDHVQSLVTAAMTEDAEDDPEDEADGYVETPVFDASYAVSGAAGNDAWTGR